MRLDEYIPIARKYMKDVLERRIPACKEVREACKRQENDLKKWSKPGSLYRFDESLAVRPCAFIEELQHVKGPLSGEKIRLEPWQVFILTTVFGWVNDLGKRRYRRVYIEVPRGNGKSALSSGIELFCLCADHEGGAECYSFATTRDQAKIVFDTSKRMASMNHALRQHYGLEVLANSLYVPSTGSTLQAKSSDASSLDGLNIHCGVIDELHAHRTREVYDVAETGTGKRLQSLLWVITTAGSNRAGICFELHTHIQRILAGTAEDESQFGIIYTIDQGDDWKSVDALRKANPNWGVSVMPDVVGSLQAKAISVASAANNFKTKHLNVWVSADASWMNMEKWNALADRTLDLDDFDGEECAIGLDLASKKDICAKVRLFRREESGVPHYYVFGDYYLPEDTIEQAANSQYRGWVDLGFLTATPGSTTDFGMVEDSIRSDLSRFAVSAVAYDPWQATQLANELSDEGAPMVECRQTVQNLSEPMKTLEALVLEGRIHHDGNLCLAWMMSNVVAHLDAKDNIYPRKQRPEEKIDGIVALIIALGRFVSGEQNRTNLDDFIRNMAVI